MSSCKNALPDPHQTITRWHRDTILDETSNFTVGKLVSASPVVGIACDTTQTIDVRTPDNGYTITEGPHVHIFPTTLLRLSEMCASGSTICIHATLWWSTTVFRVSAAEQRRRVSRRVATLYVFEGAPKWHRASPGSIWEAASQAVFS